MKANGKTVAAAASALALASMGMAPLAAIAAPADGQTVVETPVTAQAQQDAGRTAEGVAAVSGTFGFTQDVITPVSQLSGVFAKSAAVLCQSLPDYGCTQCASTLLMRAPRLARDPGHGAGARPGRGRRGAHHGLRLRHQRPRRRSGGQRPGPGRAAAKPGRGHGSVAFAPQPARPC